jgi:tetratricopeptide (TPR) repeat protein
VARQFRLLGLHPGPDISAASIAALAEADLPETLRLVTALVRAHMLEEHQPDRYRMHDLLRAYAAQLAGETETVDASKAALTRLYDYYLRQAESATAVLTDPGADRARYDQAITWLETERPNLPTVAFSASRNSPNRTISPSVALWPYMHIRGRHDGALSLHTNALDAARAMGDLNLEGHALDHLGSVCWQLAHYDEALDHLHDALTIADAAGGPTFEGHTRCNLGLVYTWLNRFDEAQEHLRSALDSGTDTGNPALRGHALGNLGTVHERLGDYREAETELCQAIDLAGQTGIRALEGHAQNTLGMVLARTNRSHEAHDLIERARAIAQKTANRALETHTLNNPGLVLAHLGRPEEARTHLERALALTRETGNRVLEPEILHNLAHTTVGHRAAASPTAQ